MTALSKLMNMEGRLALVTGATGCLGQVISDSLAELGADLLLVDLYEDDCVAEKIKLTKKWDVKVNYHCCDLEEQREREQLIDMVKDNYNNMSVVVNNAAFVGTSGLTGWAESLEKQSIETWRRALEVNLTAAFDISKGLIPLLSKSPGASIVNIASIYGELGPDWSLYEGTNMANPAAYSASKAGLLQLTRWFATTVAPDIRVNAISPGGIFRNQHEKFVARYIDRTPLDRMGKEEDFKGAIAYLASDLSSYVTGQNVVVDGGWSIW